jgi:uncharacterized membrane protein
MECMIDSSHEKLHELNRRISLVLRIGIGLSLALITAGLILFFVTGAPHMGGLTPLSSLPAGLGILSPAAFVTAGLVVILLMPPTMLVLSLAHFISVREKKPVITCIVLLILLAASFILLLK